MLEIRDAASSRGAGQVWPPSTAEARSFATVVGDGVQFEFDGGASIQIESITVAQLQVDLNLL